MRILAGVLVAVVLAAAMPRQPLSAATACDRLTSLALPNVTITLARDVAAGAFTPTSEGGGDDPPANPRALQRPAGVLPRRRDAEAVERLRHQDRSLDAGVRTGTASSRRSATARSAASIAYPAMAAALARGYATSPPTPVTSAAARSFALGHPEKADRFRLACRARDDRRVEGDHRRATTAPAPRFSYWNGCSAGGRQAMKEAQRFPGGFRRHHRRRAGARLDRPRGAGRARRAGAGDKNAARLSPPQSADCCISAVVEACDALDGVKDGLIDESDALQVRSGGAPVQGAPTDRRA